MSAKEPRSTDTLSVRAQRPLETEPGREAGAETPPPTQRNHLQQHDLTALSGGLYCSRCRRIYTRERDFASRPCVSAELHDAEEIPAYLLEFRRASELPREGSL